MVKTNLENAGLNVIVNPKKIAKDDQDKYKENQIVEQSAKVDSKLEPGDTIFLYYAVFTVEYPDFVNENYTIDMVQEFCDKNDITLSVQYQISDEYPADTIIKQDRTGEVISGSTLTITVTRPSQTEEPEGLE